MTVLKSLSVSITFAAEEVVNSSVLLSEQAGSELDKIRELQTEINTVITEKITSLKAENKLPEQDAIEEEECETDDDEE